MEIEEYLRRKSSYLKKEAEQTKDHRVFDFNYVPEKPLVREEVRPIADAVLRYAQTGIPNHLFIVGSRGSGKTLSLKSLAQALKALPASPRFLYVNCRHHNTSFKILAEILKVRPRGYAFDELWAEFTRRFPGRLVLILDEIDLMSEKDRTVDLLYLLYGWGKTQ